MKTLAMFLLVTATAIPACAGSRSYATGRILAFDTGQQRAKDMKHVPKDEIIYQVQIGATIYKVTDHSKKHEFAAGEDVECRVDKGHVYIQKLKGGEVKYDIVGESAEQERAPN